jgi:hypothetical protein
MDSVEPGGGDELRRVSAELANRLTSLGIHLTGRERPEELVDLVEAVDRFEAAVESQGGDLMMDEPPAGRAAQPDDTHFALPRRDEGESVAHYLEGLARATDAVRRHPRRAD